MIWGRAHDRSYSESKMQIYKLNQARNEIQARGVSFSRPYHLLLFPFLFLSHHFKPFDGGACPFIYTTACSSCSLSSTWYQLCSYLLGIILSRALFSHAAASSAHDVIFEDVSYHVTHNFLPRKWMPLGVIARKSLQTKSIIWIPGAHGCMHALPAKTHAQPPRATISHYAFLNMLCDTRAWCCAMIIRNL